MKTLKQLIKDGKFNYVNSDITEEHFPSEKIRGKVKIFPFDRSISSKDAVKEMAKEGYEPANIYELLEYAEKDWNGKELVFALGSVWHYRGVRFVAFLWDDSGRRSLNLDWFGDDWSSRYRFAVVYKTSN